MKTIPKHILMGVVWVTGFCMGPRGFAGEVLTNEALFYRCYGQLTQSYPEPTNSKLIEVMNGKNAITACMEILDKAKFAAAANTRIADPTDSEAKAVLSTLHRFHVSWFSSKEYTAPGFQTQLQALQDLYDTESPALYLDRALFKPRTELTSIFAAGPNLRSVRTENDPTLGARTGFSKDRFVFSGGAFKLAASGELLGAEPIQSQVLNYAFGANRTGTLNLATSYGGGIIGSAPYLLLNVQEDAQFAADGGLKMPRKWARSVFSDLLCRKLPLVRQTDVAARFVVPTSPVPFRKEATCMQCHISMDRVASVIRNFRYSNLGFGNTPNQAGGNFAKFLPITHGPLTSWPSTGDYPTLINPDRSGDDLVIPPKPAPPAKPYYNLTEPSGTFFMRNYENVLINEPLTDVSSLSTLLSTLPDFYLCTAKRYYQYFMGVDVDLDPLHTSTLTSVDQMHHDAVVALGLALKDDATDRQSLRRLIFKILNLPHYKKSDFGAERGQP